MNNQLYIQEGVVSTSTKKGVLAQLFDMKKWVTNLLVDYGLIANDPCCLSGVTGINGNISNAKYAVYNNLTANGTSASTTLVLNYGVNIVTSVTLSNYACKLPQPVTGQVVRVINSSTLPLVLYPSNVGGSINNQPINQPVTIPPNGSIYEFICIVNPMPGAWTWSNPATNEYNSGIITVNTTGTNKFIAASDANNFIENTGVVSSTAWTVDALSKPLQQSGGVFKPQTAWKGMTKIKVYTNLSATSQNTRFVLAAAYGSNYYDPVTGAFVNFFLSAGNYSPLAYCNQTIAGASLPQGTLTPNIGDAGTCWGEVSFNGGYVGDAFNALISNPGTPPPSQVNEWLCSAISFNISPAQSLTGFKFQFFIEYF